MQHSWLHSYENDTWNLARCPFTNTRRYPYWKIGGLVSIILKESQGIRPLQPGKSEPLLPLSSRRQIQGGSTRKYWPSESKRVGGLVDLGKFGGDKPEKSTSLNQSWPLSPEGGVWGGSHCFSKRKAERSELTCKTMLFLELVHKFRNALQRVFWASTLYPYPPSSHLPILS